ncbi:hypothetical protein QEG73_17675 [Chitinophagaceae bacterium 26-R-25]|nr:hypothetical protein [Chitinophagaceae bacterium 26-R-25]
MKRKYELLIFCIMMVAFSASQAQVSESGKIDSTFRYVPGEGTYIRLSKKDKFIFNINATLQPGMQTMDVDTGSKVTHSNRMSLNLVRLAFNVSAFNNQLTMGLVSDFTGTTGILEGWLGLASKNQQYRLVLGERQTNTNNRLAMADEKYASVMGPSVAGKSTDGSIYGGLMQNFVGSTREGGIFFETNFTINNKMRLYPSVSVTTGEGQGFWDAQSDAGFKYGGRIDFMPMGDFIKNNAFIAQDIYREPTPKLGIGIAGSYNVKASNAVGGGHGTVTGIYDESGNAAYADYRKLVVDAIFKYKGFAFVGEYTDASVYGKNLFTDAAASVRMSPAIASSKYNLGSGLNLQSSYVLKDGWAFEGRYSFVKPEFDTATSLIQKQDWFTIGINKYIMNNAFRIGINTTCIKQNGAIADKTTWISNLAVQLSF